MTMLELLRQDGYIIVSKTLANKIGLHETIIFSVFLSVFYHTKLEWFYVTEEYLNKQTSLSRYFQAKAIENLTKIGFIQFKVKGIPARRHFKINVDDENMLQFLKGSKTCIETLPEQVMIPVQDYYNNKSNINNTINQNPKTNNFGGNKLNREGY